MYKKSYKEEPFTIYPFMFDYGLDNSSIITWAIIYKYTKERLGYNRPTVFIKDLTDWSYVTVMSSMKKLKDLGIITKTKDKNSTKTCYVCNIRKNDE